MIPMQETIGHLEFRDRPITLIKIHKPWFRKAYIKLFVPDLKEDPIIYMYEGDVLTITHHTELTRNEISRPTEENENCPSAR